MYSKNISIPFNKPFLTGKETKYIENAVSSLQISGDGIYSKKCHDFFEKKYGFRKTLLTTSCTDALEMAAILLDIKEDDEVIMPSYTFVSTANAFVLRGAKIIFADSLPDHPNIDHTKIEALITEKTKAIVPVHYAGRACEMDKIIEIANKYNLFVVEDAAQAIDSYYKNRPLGSFGNLATFSFHETKNIISGEGGLLIINDESLIKRAEIIREKGTNRTQFHRGEVNKYDWIDIGSSFLPSDIIAAFLYAQLEMLEIIQNKRLEIWNKYYNAFKVLEENDKVRLPTLDSNSTNNAHLFYLILSNKNERDQFLSFMRKNEINPVFHYLSLHKSPYFVKKHDSRELTESDRYSNTLIRLPLFYTLTDDELNYIIKKTKEFFLK